MVVRPSGLPVGIDLFGGVEAILERQKGQTADKARKIKNGCHPAVNGQPLVGSGGWESGGIGYRSPHLLPREPQAGSNTPLWGHGHDSPFSWGLCPDLNTERLHQDV